MSKYRVYVIEKLVKSVIVEAENSVEAYEKVEAMCNNSEIVLTADDFTDRDIDVDEEDEVSEDE